MHFLQVDHDQWFSDGNWAHLLMRGFIFCLKFQGLLCSFPPGQKYIYIYIYFHEGFYFFCLKFKKEVFTKNK